MQRIRRHIQQGFTLLEMLLVSVIAMAMLGLLINYTTQTADEMRRNKTVIDMQQILNAASAYYNQYGKWPTYTSSQSCTDWDHYNGDNSDAGEAVLQKSGFLPKVVMKGAGGNIYYSRITGSGNFVVVTALGTSSKAAANAQVIAGQLPSGTIGGDGDIQPNSAPSCNIGSTSLATCSGENCYAVSQIPPPGQNLNNARSVNFSALYHSGQCVPVPTCPTGMTPQIFVVPTQVSGNYQSTNIANNTEVSPITSYAAYAIPYAALGTEPGYCNNTPQVSQAKCTNTSNVTGSAIGYWRVCLSITTQTGLVNPGAWPDIERMGIILAITRCVPGTTSTSFEPTGSQFNVYQ